MASMSLRRWVASALPFVIGTACTAVILPVNNDFEVAEGYSLGPVTAGNGWTFAGSLSTNIVGDGFSGDQGLSLQGAGWLTFSAEGWAPNFDSSVTWIDFYLKPVFADAAHLPSEVNNAVAAVTGFVKIGSTGEVYAVDGDGLGGGDWMPTGYTTTLVNEEAANWLRISYRLNYGSKRWDLFLDGNLVMVDLKFADNEASPFSQFRLKGDSDKPALLDYFYIGSENPLFTDTSGTGLPDNWLLAHGLSPLTVQRYGDPDHDGVDNLTEFRLGLSPNAPDSDNDRVFDRREILRGANPGAAEAYVLGEVPFSDGFEADAIGSFANGTRLWQVNFDEDALIEVTNADGNPEGLRSLRLVGSGISLARDFAGSVPAPVVWLDFQFKAAPRATPPEDIPADVAAVFYFDADGRTMALNGGGNGGGEWVFAGASLPEWNRVSLRMDYPAQRWALWLNGVRFADNLGFAHPVPFFSGFALHHSGSSPASFDGFQVRYDEPANLDNDGDGLTNEIEVGLGTNPESVDSDTDGISDPIELQLGLNPLLSENFIARLINEGNGVHAWRTSFAVSEGYSAGDLSGQLGWQASGATATVAEDAQISAEAGVTSVMEHYLGASGLDQAWVSFRARLSVGTLPQPSALSGQVSSLFGFRGDTTLAVYNSAQGAWVDYPVAATAGEWNEYAIYLDYRTQRWLLVLNGALVARDLPFRDTGLSTITRFRMLQASSEESEDAQGAFIDDLIISNTEPAGFDFDNDGLSNLQERELGLDYFNGDTDGDGMPDGWEVANGLNPSVSDSSTDLDNDGFSNGIEFAHDTNPNEITTALAGFAHWAEWQSVTGSTVATLTGNTRFPNSPDHRALIAGLELPSGRGVNYGTRLRAWLKPTMDGEHVFWIAGDDVAELWLSTDETPFERKLIAFTSKSTAVHEWERYPETQRSVPVVLQAGERYYIEVLHKQSSSFNHVAVAWQTPAEGRVQLPADVLEAFPRFENDQDEDGLPDDWERANGLSVGLTDITHGSYGDFDKDGVTNFEEFTLGLNPNAVDSDGDGLADGLEINAGSSASDPQDIGQSLSPWIVASVGLPKQAAGTIKDANGVIWMMGNEGGPTGSGDTYRYLNQPVTGDFDLVVAVKETDATEGSFGLILRDGLGSKAPTVYLELQKGGYYRFFSRPQVNAPLRQYGKLNSTGAPTSIDGYWLRLRRQGDLVSAYYSRNGTHWTYFTGVNQALPSSCLLGFATWNGVAAPTIREIKIIRLRLDGDGDGLYDDEEILLGTAIDSADTDGDGLSDYEEVINIGTDALGANAPALEVASYSGIAGVVVRGAWSVNSDALWSEAPLGSVEYVVGLPADGVYRVQLDVTCPTNLTSDFYFPLEFSVDGQFVQRVEIPIPEGEAKSVSVTLPWLTAGNHHVTVFFDNTLTHRKIALNTLRVNSLGGADADQNGRPDWIDTRLTAFNRFKTRTGESYTSPAYIEGSSRFSKMMELAADEAPMLLTVAPNHGWYANVPLPVDRAIDIIANFENGALSESIQITWKIINVLDGSASLPTPALRIRKGDSLLLTAFTSQGNEEGGSATLAISRNGAAAVGMELDDPRTTPFAYKFEQTGNYTISGIFIDGAGVSQSGFIQIEVVGAEFKNDPTAGLNNVLSWSNPLMTAGNFIETDKGISLTSTDGQNFKLLTESLGESRVLVRLAEGGPVLDQAIVYGLRVANNGNTSIDLVTQYDDGSKLISTPIVLNRVPSDVKVVVEIFVNAVTFEDGTILKTLTADDFDETGQAIVKFIYPAGLSTSYCHRIHVYVGNTNLGTF